MLGLKLHLALTRSLKYHRLHPEYIHTRIEKMRNSYSVRIMLIFCDIVSSTVLCDGGHSKLTTQTEHAQSLRELTKVAIINDFTVFVAWS